MVLLVFYESSLKMLSKVYKFEKHRVLVGFVSAMVRKQRWQLFLKTFISSIVIRYICLRKLWAARCSWAHLSGWVVWRRWRVQSNTKRNTTRLQKANQVRLDSYGALGARDSVWRQPLSLLQWSIKSISCCLSIPMLSVRFRQEFKKLRASPWVTGHGALGFSQPCLAATVYFVSKKYLFPVVLPFHCYLIVRWAYLLHTTYA